MHPNQRKILELAQTHNLAKMTLRDIGEKANVGNNPQLIRHHLNRLIKNGFLTIDKKSEQMKLATEGQNDKSSLVSVPIMGQANCGQALSFADNEVEGYIQISGSLIKKHSTKPYALRAVGNSMTQAEVPTFGSKVAGIEDGDYIIIDGNDITANNNDYIVSLIDGLANIKKLRQDQYGLRLISESDQPIPPITIDPARQDFAVGGKVIAVVKS